MMSPELVTLPELVEVEDDVETWPVEVETCPVLVETCPVEVETCPVEVELSFELSISILISPSNPLLVEVVVVVVVVEPGWPLVV